MPSYSPWGPVQDRTPIVDGVSWVSTASHGGLMVTRKAASKYLSQRAIEVAFPGGGETASYVCFEEDCSYAVAFYERPEWKRILDAASLQEWRDYQTGRLPDYCGIAKHAEERIPKLEAAIAKTDEQIKETMAAIVREWNPEYFETRKAEALEMRAA